ncbi:MAG: Trp family transcriptional regulator [bacterium]|nr:Trp family transcriptional regulator [bacterium]
MKKQERSRTKVSPVQRHSSCAAWEDAAWRFVLAHPEIIELLCTARERKDLSARAEILNRLHARVPQRRIARELSVSRQTINAVKKAAEAGYQSYRERGKTERKRGPGRGMLDHGSGEIRNYVKTKYGRVRTY